VTWALDLGTTNTGVARWDTSSGEPELVPLPRLCRRPRGQDPLEAPALVPSVVQMLEPATLVDRIGTWRRLERFALWGRAALVGRPALERNLAIPDPAFVPGFKAALAFEPLRPLARLGRTVITARQAARAFVREVFAEVGRETGRRVRDLVVTVPVDAYEGYRAEIEQIARSLGVARLRFLDEPLAAALGYGLSLEAERTVLVVDIGGGTLHVALVRLGAAGLQQGHAEVLAKQGRPLGGNAVDGWLLELVCERMGYALEDLPDEEQVRLWRRLMLAEACRVKEALFFRHVEEFLLTPPGVARRVSRHGGGGHPFEVTREDLVEVLRQRGFYTVLTGGLEAVLAEGSGAALPAEAVDDVLVVGGSTLLPGVFAEVEQRFGRPRVRAWHPFEAVAKGAASFAADRFAQLDFIVHDYAFVTYDATSHEPIHTVVVPRGTRFPTPPDLWRGQLVPTCSLGAPETSFKLLVSEIGGAGEAGRRFVWDAAGNRYKVGGDGATNGRVVVPLNDANPTLGTLDPPHSPRDRRPRLEVSFGVDENRWLITTVFDLLSRRTLMEGQPVVRLL
jgi:molecular chaperone DnaK (HSP70)